MTLSILPKPTLRQSSLLVMRWRDRYSTWSLVLAVTFFIATAILSYREVSHANTLANLRIGHSSHALFKTYEALNKLITSIDDYTYLKSPGKARLDELKTNFELVASRVNVFTEGEANRQLLANESVTLALSNLTTAIQMIEPQIGILSTNRKDSHNILIKERLINLREEFLVLTKNSLLNAGLRSEELSLHRASFQNNWVATAPIFTGGALLILFFIQWYRSSILAKVYKKKSLKLLHLAMHDDLTGLPNRALLIKKLSLEIRKAEESGRSFALIFLDLDRFKEVNDSLGHAHGDVLLTSVSERLRECVREIDTVARISGDEFVLLINDCDSDNILKVVTSRLASKFAIPFMLLGHEVTITSSMGLSMYPRDGDTEEILLLNADAAMYNAKANGRNSICTYTADMTTGNITRLELLRDLRYALERKQLIVYYQPIVELVSERIIGVEALLRWQHPTRGLLGPDTFISLAEQSGLILPIGEWVIQEACSQAVAWHEEGLPLLKLSVNLSIVQFRQKDLTKQIADTLNITRFPAELLVVELTETQLLRNVGEAVTATQALRALGIGLAVDDFGTGYCSLSYLQRFPVTELKIDRSFVKDALNTVSAKAIVTSIIGLGESLGLEVVAEGIETSDQLDFLREHGCGFGQGYLFNRPLPAFDFALQLTANKINLPASYNQNDQQIMHALNQIPLRRDADA